MAELWLYLNDTLTQADLYRDLHGLDGDQKIDHRIFSGKINAVDGRLVHRMRQKFAEAGVDTPLLEKWLDEFQELSPSDRVPYARIRPLLIYLEEHLNLHPTAVLKQSVVRYESGLLKSVSRAIFERAEALKRQTQRALRQGSRQAIERIRESVVGGKAGYTPYADIRDELLFLRRYARQSAKQFLGRGLWTYETGKANRIADWRARKIVKASDRFIRRSPGIPLGSLPPSRRRAEVRKLMDLLVARTSQRLAEKEGIDFEKRILKPSHPRDAYSNPYHGFTPFDMASRALGMRRRAFDLMVAKNCEIFRSVGRFSQRWYLPDLYLKELSGKKDFTLISAKYERMAATLGNTRLTDSCLE
jgi:hypothetical protein